MKKFLKKSLIITAVFLLFAVIIIFLFSSLEKSGILDGEKGNIILGVISVIAFFFYAFSIGFATGEKGWIIGLLLATLYIILAMIVLGSTNKLEPYKIVLMSVKSIGLTIGAIIGVNKSRKSIKQ